MHHQQQHEPIKNQHMRQPAGRIFSEDPALKQNIKKGFSILADCYVNQDGVSILRLLMDSGEPVRVRVKAAEMIGDIGELESIEPIQSFLCAEPHVSLSILQYRVHE